MYYTELNQNSLRIMIKSPISMKIVIKSPIDNRSTLVQMLVWHRTRLNRIALFSYTI